MVEIRNILCPCDLTENLEKILPYALSMSEKYNSTIYLVHVVRDPHYWISYFAAPYVSPSFFDQDRMLHHAEEALTKVWEELLGGDPSVKRMVSSGDPAVEILNIIESEDIDLVVMGTHGRKGLDHTIFGSVAERVLKKSPVPVLIINPYRLS